MPTPTASPALNCLTIHWFPESANITLLPFNNVVAFDTVIVLLTSLALYKVKLLALLKILVSLT